MSISAQPYSLAGLTSIKPMFDELGLSGPDPIIVRSGADSGLSETEALDFHPGAKSLKARVITLIENNRPNIALDLMQGALRDDRDLFDKLFFEVEEALEDNGFERDAEELKRMSAQPQIEEPKIDYAAVQNSLVLG